MSRTQADRTGRPGIEKLGRMTAPPTVANSQDCGEAPFPRRTIRHFLALAKMIDDLSYRSGESRGVWPPEQVLTTRDCNDDLLIALTERWRRTWFEMLPYLLREDEA